MKQDNQGKQTRSGRNGRLWLTLAVILVIALLVCGISVLLLLTYNTDSPNSAVTRIDSTSENTANTPREEIGQTISQDKPEVLTPITPRAGSRSAGDPYAPELGNTGYDVKHYTLQLALDPADETVRGSAIIEAQTTIPGLAEMSLDFIGFELTSVTVDGIATNFLRQDEKLIIALPEMKGENDPFTVVVTYHGSPQNETSTYVQFVDHLGLYYPDGDSLFVVAEPDGARYWFPANDHPRDKATFRFEVVVPTGLTAAANGILLKHEPAVIPGGSPGELFIWQHDRAMAPYLAFIAVAEYERIDALAPNGIPLRHYYFPGLKEELLEATSEVGDALVWMASLFGPYPFETFGYITAHIPGASMETQTMVLLSSTMMGKRTAIHELAHMWFGDWVSLDSWGEMWRNEGFATYVQLMWETGDDPEELALRMAALEAVVEGNDKDYPLNQPPPNYLFDLNIYYQGALAVHALREEVGDEAFFNGLWIYFDRFGGKTASDADFRSVMEESVGRSLESYFRQWFPDF